MIGRNSTLSAEQLEIVEIKDYFDRIVPSAIRFFTDHYICGNFYKSVWAITEYPPTTEETAILAHLADRSGVTLRIYNRLVTSVEQKTILQQAMRKNHMMSTTNDVNESIKAEDNMSDIVNLLSELRRNKEKRTDDKTNSNILILGNSGQGKSYLMKLLLCNLRESGKSIICLDPEHEYEDLCNNLGGTYIDMMSGEFMINPLEPKAWSDGQKDSDDSPETFRKVTRLSQHISYLKDFFRAYKDFTDAEIDTIEIMLMKLYARFGIDDFTDFDKLNGEDYPIMSDLYELIEKEFLSFDSSRKHLYTEEILQNICLGLHSMCKGAESKYFDGHTNIRDGKFICFGVKELMDTNKRLKDTLLFNILSYMSNQLLGRGNTVAAVDELYLFLTNMTAIEYIRNGMKRVRKKEFSFILASQNINDFLLPEIKEFTKPLFSIPTYSFLFHPGNISPVDFM